MTKWHVAGTWLAHVGRWVSAAWISPSILGAGPLPTREMSMSIDNMGPGGGSSPSLSILPFNSQDGCDPWEIFMGKLRHGRENDLPEVAEPTIGACGSWTRVVNSSPRRMCCSPSCQPCW